MKPAASTQPSRRSLRLPTTRPFELPTVLKRTGPRLTLLLALALLVWLGQRQLTTPSVVPADAPAGEFSAARAMTDLSVIAAEPHVVGSPQNAAVRQYLIDQIRALGLEPQVQTASQVAAEGETWYRAGVVNNVIVRVPGTKSTGTIAIDAHYDSVNTGPGASDCGSCVVTALETLRAVKAGPALQNDLLFVFTDGEERHMLGAAAFNEQSPLAKDIRLALNFEAQGSSGPAILYVTSKNDRWLVSQFLKVAPHASAYSLIATISDLYSEGRFDSDLGWYTAQGSQGLGFIYIGNTSAYHNARDNIDTINPGSIQQEGGYSLALVRHFGNLDLARMPANSGDSVFFTLLPGVVVHYADTWALPLAALITFLFAGLLVLGIRRDELTIGGLLAGLLVFVLSMVVAVTLAVVTWIVVRLLNPAYQIHMVGNDQTSLYVVALSFIALAAVAAIYAVFGRTVRPHNLAAGVLLGWTLPLWLLSLLTPTLSYLITWPLLFGMLPLAWSLLWPNRSWQAWPKLFVLIVAAVPAILLLPGTMYQMVALINRFEGVIDQPLLGIVILFVAPVIALLVPHLQFLGSGESTRARWFVPIAAGVVALILILIGNVTAGFSDARPRPDRIAYVLNADSSRAQWVSLDQNLDDFTRQFFPAGTSKSNYTSLEGSNSAFVTDAPAVALASPEVTVVSDRTTGDTRTLSLHLNSPRGLTEMTAVVQTQGAVEAATVDGRSVDLGASNSARNGKLRLIYADVQPQGWDLTLTVRSTGLLELQLEEASDGLPNIPGMTLPVRPSDTMPALEYPRDPTIVTKTLRFP